MVVRGLLVHFYLLETGVNDTAELQARLRSADEHSGNRLYEDAADALAAQDAEIAALRKSNRDNEDQLVRIANAIGKDARDAPEHDRTIAGAAIAEIASLKTVMIAAAEEISEHWNAHCDAEGYGPQNLLRRLEEGIPSEYGYTAGAFAALRAERDAAVADAGCLRWRLQAIIPLFEEARDALPAITLASAKLHRVDLSLGARMDKAGTATRADFDAARTQPEPKP